MILLLSLTVVLILTIVSLYAVLLFYSRDVSRKELELSEMLWKRLNRIPLLIEFLESGEISLDRRKEIIELRQKLLSSAYTLDEEVVFEKELSKLCDYLLHQARQHKNTKLIALEQEFFDLIERIRIAVNDYNFSLKRLKDLLSLPIFHFFPFLIDKSRSKLIVSI